MAEFSGVIGPSVPIQSVVEIMTDFYRARNTLNTCNCIKGVTDNNADSDLISQEQFEAIIYKRRNNYHSIKKNLEKIKVILRNDQLDEESAASLVRDINGR